MSFPSEWSRGAAFASALHLRIEGEPCAASRPRVTKFGSYYSKPYANWKAAALEQLAALRLNEVITDPVAVAVEVVSTRPKTTKLGAPRYDIDNAVKSALDALTRSRVWLDDTLVRTLVATKRWTTPGESPGFNIWIAPH